MSRNLLMYFFLTIFLIVMITLSGCSSTQPTADFSIQAANYLNPDLNGRASPIVVTAYQLISVGKFKSANFNKLNNNPGAALGTDLLDKKTFEIRPGANTNIEINLSKNTKYIGIVAGYRNIHQAQWKTSLVVPPKSNYIAILLNLESQGLSASLN